MHYSRRDFLKVAAGSPLVGAAWFFSSVARAGAEAEGGYTQARADRIHDRSTEDAIRRAGEDPEEVKARVERRLRELRANAVS